MHTRDIRENGKIEKNRTFGFPLFCSVHDEYLIFRICIMLSMLYCVDLMRNCYVYVVVIVLL